MVSTLKRDRVILEKTPSWIEDSTYLSVRDSTTTTATATTVLYLPYITFISSRSLFTPPCRMYGVLINYVQKNFVYPISILVLPIVGQGEEGIIIYVPIIIHHHIKNYVRN